MNPRRLSHVAHTLTALLLLAAAARPAVARPAPMAPDSVVRNAAIDQKLDAQVPLDLSSVSYTHLTLPTILRV